MKKIILLLIITIVLTSCTQINPINEENLKGLRDNLFIEMVKPAERDSKWENARCNDGTPFGFELFNTEKDEWVIFLQGGGACNDINFPCEGRGKSTTPSKGDGEEVNSQFSGILSINKQINPLFWNANKVDAHYCSSDVWSGTRTETISTTGGDFYFSGQLNFRAMIEILKEDYGLDKNDKILLIGSSAGGHGVLSNIHTARELLPDNKIYFVNDGGAVWDFDNPKYRVLGTNLSLEEVMQQSYNFWQSDLLPACEEAQDHPGSCFLQNIIYPYIEEPFLVQGSTTDSFFLGVHGIKQTDIEGLESFKETTLRNSSEIDWYFGMDHPYHTIAQNNQLIHKKVYTSFYDVLTAFWNDEKSIHIMVEI
jgi:hypothetical protein